MSARAPRLAAPAGLLQANELFDHVLSPLVLGGSVNPQRPLGLALGDDVASQGDAVTRRGDALVSRVEIARVRVARQLHPFDTLAAPDFEEWRLVAAWNDLLQVANPYLPGIFAANRPARLLALVRRCLQRIAPPATLRACVCRHATLSRVLELRRTDIDVSWWTGSQRFRGETPPPRLLAWPERRRVRTERRDVELWDLPPEALRRDFASAVGELLAHTPLTDLSTAKRATPPFAWAAATLSLLASPLGRTLARRALPGGTRTDVALERASDLLPPAARTPVLDFLSERRALSALSP